MGTSSAAAAAVDAEALSRVAQQLAAPGKGLLASDESVPTLGKRLERAGLSNDEETRRAYRALFYASPIGAAGISGAIMFKEALEQRADDGTPFVECLRRQGVLAGVKVDEGLAPLGPGHDLATGETTTKGLEALAAAAAEYAAAGAAFAKWRAALRVDAARGFPSEQAVQRNAEQLAEYAAIVQGSGLVPIVEPEVLIDGDHSADAFGAASARAISACVAQLWRRGVLLEGCLLKPQMVVAGAAGPGGRAAPEAVAEATLRVMRRVVPPAIPGIMFLSGGQSEEEATRNLNAINVLARQGGQQQPGGGRGGAPWALSFSFGRGLQASVLKLWSEGRAAAAAAGGGEEGRSIAAASEAAARRMAVALAEANAAASLGRFEGPHPSAIGGSLHETFRGHR